MSHRRLRHLPFSLGSGTTGAKLVLYAPAMRGYADGDPVGTWSDVSGQGNNATASGTARPTYKTAIQGGMPIVRFNGNGNALQHPLNLGSSAATMLVTLKANSGSPNPSIVAACAPFSPLGANLNAYGNGSATWSTYANAFVYSTKNIQNSWFMIAEIARSYNATNGIDLVTNGIFETFTGAGTYSGDFRERRVVGCGDTLNGFLWGDISEVIVYNAAINSAMLKRIQQSSGFTFRIATR